MLLFKTFEDYLCNNTCILCLFNCIHCTDILCWAGLHHSVVSDSSRPHRLQPTRLLRPWNFPGKGTGVSCHFLLQGIFPTQELNLGLPHCRQTLYHLSHQGSSIIEISPISKSNLWSSFYSRASFG